MRMGLADQAVAPADHLAVGVETGLQAMVEHRPIASAGPRRPRGKPDEHGPAVTSR